MGKVWDWTKAQADEWTIAHWMVAFIFFFLGALVFPFIVATLARIYLLVWPMT